MDNEEGLYIELDDVGNEEATFSLFQNEEQEKEIIEMLVGEFDCAYNEWELDRLQWAKWRRQKEAYPEQTSKNFPFPNSSNIEVPLQKIITNTTFGELSKLFAVRDPFFTAVAQRRDNADDIEKAKILTKYMNMLAESSTDLHLRYKNRTILLEAAHMGINVCKVPYIQKPISFITGGPTGEKKVNMLKDGPDVIPIPREDFLYRKSFQDIQSMPWCGHFVHLSYPELMQRSNVYDNISKIEDHGRDPSSEIYEPNMVENRDNGKVAGNNKSA